MKQPRPSKVPAGFSVQALEGFESGKYATSRLLSSELCTVLAELGVEFAFGLIGGANAAFAHSLGQSPIRVIHCRHEGAAGFAAAEAYFASGKPAVVFATTGPGLLNALNGVAAARWEGAKLILISGITSADQRGRWGAQETSAMTLPMSGLFTAGPIFNYAATIEDPSEFTKIAARLTLGLQRPEGFVAHIALPISMQRAVVPGKRIVPVHETLSSGCSEELVRSCAERMRRGKSVIWTGFGARHASKSIRLLAEHTGSLVMSTPRGKGIVPESHPLYIGVTGMGGHDTVYPALAASPPDHVLVLGTRMGEGSSFWSERLVPRKSFIHVDLDPDVPGAAYPGAPTIAVRAEIEDFVERMLAYLASCDEISCVTRSVAPRKSAQTETSALAPRVGRVRPALLMQEIQRVVVDGSDAIVMAESGNAFSWATQCLSFQTANRYRVSTGYGSMGHFTAGAVGAALARGGKVVAIVGDGAMLMNNEINTAVQYNAPAVWIILNDARYGMVEQGMRALGFQVVEPEFPQCDFVAIARGMGADGIRVTEEEQLGAALQLALDSKVPFVVDVFVDPNEPSPVLKRVQSLVAQGSTLHMKPSSTT
jgi:acetolactate synthase-1/2/3 large subunit